MQQGIKKGQLVIGISFGGNQVYIAKQADCVVQEGLTTAANQFIGTTTTTSGSGHGGGGGWTRMCF